MSGAGAGTAPSGGLLGRLRAVTLAVADLEVAVAAYRDALGYRLVDTGYVPEALAQSWAAPANADARYGVMAPASGADVFIRLVEGELPTNFAPLRTFGWAAAEIAVADVDGLAASLEGSPFAVIGPPADLAFAGGALRAMQAQGPSGEILIFTQIKGPVAGFELPAASAPVDRVFIAVLAAEDIEKARAFYRDKLVVAAGGAFETPIRTLNDAFGLEPDERHPIATVNLPDASYVEIDQYPDMAARRQPVRGFLMPGIAMATFEGAGLDDLPLYCLAEPMAWDMQPYAGRRQVTFYGAAGELIELVEATS